MGTKKYTRLDEVEAEPMTCGEFYKMMFGEEYVQTSPHTYEKDAPGYSVKRPTGQEWIPKEDFDVEFAETDDYISRMNFERDELLNRLNKLESYLKYHTDDYPSEMLACAMRLYLHRLEKCIRRSEAK